MATGNGLPAMSHHWSRAAAMAHAPAVKSTSAAISARRRPTLSASQPPATEPAPAAMMAADTISCWGEGWRRRSMWVRCPAQAR